MSALNLAPERPYVRHEVVDNLAILTLVDPATLNAMSGDMAESLASELSRAARSSRAVLLTGEGRSFCSGARLTSGGFDPTDPRYDAGQAIEDRYNPLIKTIRSLPIPLIVAVNGAAAGFGCSLALAGDIIVASQAAYFLQAFRNIGLVPDGGSTHLLVRAIGRVRANQLMLSGDRLSATDALAMGLINEVVAAADLRACALKWTRQLADGPTKALALTKSLSWSAVDSNFEEQLQAERQAQKLAGATLDHREGVSAFREKRKAHFVGR